MTPQITILTLVLIVALIIFTIGWIYIKFIYRLYFVIKDLYQIFTDSKENISKLYNNIQIIADNTENIEKKIQALVHNIEANTTKPSSVLKKYKKTETND